MTTTTFWGNISIWCAVLGAGATAVAAGAPVGSKTQMVLGAVSIALIAMGQAANGQGNRHSQTGSPEQ